MNDTVLFERIALIGIGLIGSSLARDIRQRNLASHIAISTRSPETLAKARKLDLGDSYSIDPTIAAEGADLVILCAPIGVCGDIAKSIAPKLKPGAIVTDVGSVKAAVVAAIDPHIPDGVHFISGHPVAGTENSGPEAGFTGLFENRWVILTPNDDVDATALQRLTDFWSACGANIQQMTPEHHDMVLAMTSHLPQLVSYNLVGTADDLETVTQSEIIKYSAGGFRDFTRLAASDPTMWRDVCLHNKDAILDSLARFSEDLSALQRLIRWGDGEALFDLFTRTRSIRHGIIEAGQEMDLPNFGRDTVEEGKSE